MIRFGVVLAVLAGLAASAAADGDLESKLDDLSREVRELRAWKAKVERDGLLPGDTGESPLEREIQAYLETESEPVAVRVPGSLELRVSGEIRIREELKHDLYSPGDSDGEESFEFAHMRTRLRFDLDVEDLIGAVVELQDIRRLGEEGSTTADSEGVDLKRAMIVIQDLLADGTTLELGRIVLHYGDQRLIGHLEWFDQGRTYDGFRFGWQDETCFVDFFGARIDDSLMTSDDTDLLGLYGGTSSFAEGLDVEGYVILVRDLDAGFGEDGKGNTRILTFGARGHWVCDGIDVTGELAYQTGEVLGDDLAAFAFAVMGGYTFEDVSWSPRIGAEIDYASGNDDLDDGDNETFQTLFPTNHLHYGYADLMGWSNMWDFRIGASAKPTDDIKLTVDWHHLRLAEPEGGWRNAGGGLVRSGDEDADEHLGDEIDVTVMWKATKALKVLLGWSHFLAGDFVDDTGDSSDADFGYVQVHLKF